MSDIDQNFHEWALNSILFKGRQDWYFCFLKSEKIAQVLSFLSEKVPPLGRGRFDTLVDDAAELSHSIVHFAAGEVGIEVLLADLFSLISSVRMSGARGYLVQDTASYIAQEYEQVARRLSVGNQLSPFVSPQDFSVPEIAPQNPPQSLSLSRFTPPSRLLSSKEANPPARPSSSNAPKQSARREIILDFILKNKAVSIKEISAVVPDCSEKTVQRELASLIGEGLIKREGERRWSIYKPA